MDQPYSAELEARRSAFGFANHRLEQEYQHAISVRSERNVRRQMLLAFGLLAALSILEFTVAKTDYSQLASMLRAAFMLPPIALVYAFTFQRRRLWLRQAVGAGTCVVVAAGAIYLGYLAASFGEPIAPGGYLIVVVFAYFFLGLRLAVSIATACAIVVEYLLFAWLSGAPLNAAAYDTFNLLMMVLVCGLGAQQLELARRRDFLTDHLLEYRANFDALTSLPNRRAFDLHFGNAWRIAHDSASNLTVMLLDIDFFKHFNDLYGHQAGDETLRRVAHALRRALKRPQDFAARYGGEEFAVVIAGGSIEAAADIAEEIRTQVIREGIRHKSSGVAECVTVSVGVCWSNPRSSGKSAEGVLQQADEALYAAKDAGRNRIKVVSADMDASKTGVFTRSAAFGKAAASETGYL